MAQLSGVMTADFSDFMFEIDKSVVKLKDLESASGHTGTAIGDFSEGLGVADKTLSAMGVHIGPQIRAFQEFSGILTKNVTDMGLWELAGASGAAFMAGWKIGTWVDEWLGLSNAIGDTTAVLLGWNSAAAQGTAAGMDVLIRATEIAGREIKNFDEAMQIIKTHNRELAESFNTGAQRVADWNREIAAHKADMPQITADLKNHSSTVQQLSQHYGISREAIEYYTRTLADSTKAQKAWADEARPKYEAIAKAQEELRQATGGWHATLLALSPAVVKAATEALNLGVSQTTIASAMNLTASQVAAVDRQMQLNLATMAATEPALGTLDQWIKTNVADTREWNNEWRFTSEVIDSQVIPALDAVTAKAQTTSAAVSAAVGVTPGMDQKSPGASIPINTGNITYGTLGSFEATFAEYAKRHPSGGMMGGAVGGGPPADFLTWALSMGLAQRAPTITNTFNIVDTESNLTRKIGDTITSQVQRGSLVN